MDVWQVSTSKIAWTIEAAQSQPCPRRGLWFLWESYNTLIQLTCFLSSPLPSVLLTFLDKGISLWWQALHLYFFHLPGGRTKSLLVCQWATSTTTRLWRWGRSESNGSVWASWFLGMTKFSSVVCDCFMFFILITNINCLYGLPAGPWQRYRGTIHRDIKVAFCY